jgi:hypothetical protein
MLMIAHAVCAGVVVPLFILPLIGNHITGPVEGFNAHPGHPGDAAFLSQ